VRGALLALVWIGVPAAWLLTVGLLGRGMNPDAALYGTAALFVSLFVGLPLALFAVSRTLLRGSERRPAKVAVRVRVPALRQMRAPVVPEAPRPPRARLGARRRTEALLILGVMFGMSVAVWTLIPVGWLWLGSQLAANGQPGVTPYALIVTGMPLTMLLCVRGLHRIGGTYAGLTRQNAGGPARPAWLKSLSAERQRRPWTTVDAVMTVSVIVALICMGVWFLLFADQHSVFEWYMD
jgi:hypothetical protein